MYGLFFIHAMPEEDGTRALQESWRLLRNGGVLFFGFRTIRDLLMARVSSLVRLNEEPITTEGLLILTNFMENNHASSSI